MRSLLFVPADSEKKLARATGVACDALCVDLEDSVLPERKVLARNLMQEYLQNSAQRSRTWIRVNDRFSGELLKDLVFVVPARPAGIVLPKIRGPEDVEAVAHYLDALEASHGIDPGSIALLVVVTETPVAVLRMTELLRSPNPRIQAVAWGAEDLSSAMGAGDPRTETGAWRPAYEYARTQCLLLAHATRVAAIDTVYVNYRDQEGLRRACEASRHDGFSGRIAIHPDQVPVINAAFTPTAEERFLAQRIVKAFASGAGAVSLDGKMYDIPHLRAAQSLLGMPTGTK